MPIREIFLIRVKLIKVVQIEFKGNCVEELNDTLLGYVAESSKKARKKM
jgi:hypothetical protein